MSFKPGSHLNDATDAYPVAPDECLDADGEVHPEHDFGELECRRCGAEPCDPEEYDSEYTALGCRTQGHSSTGPRCVYCGTELD